jgi:hypothetical protein
MENSSWTGGNQNSTWTGGYGIALAPMKAAAKIDSPLVYRYRLGVPSASPGVGMKRKSAFCSVNPG